MTKKKVSAPNSTKSSSDSFKIFYSEKEMEFCRTFFVGSVIGYKAKPSKWFWLKRISVDIS
jgi:hypothetical protein